MRRTPADEEEEAKLVAELQAIDGAVKKDKVRVKARKHAETITKEEEGVDEVGDPKGIALDRPRREIKKQKVRNGPLGKTKMFKAKAQQVLGRKYVLRS